MQENIYFFWWVLQSWIKFGRLFIITQSQHLNIIHREWCVIVQLKHTRPLDLSSNDITGLTLKLRASCLWSRVKIKFCWGVFLFLRCIFSTLNVKSFSWMLTIKLQIIFVAWCYARRYSISKVHVPCHYKK